MLRRVLVECSKLLPLRLIPLDSLLRFSQRVSSSIAGLVFIRDWNLEASGRPQFFKHQINLSRWISEPIRWSFAARGVYAREHMHKGCKVLDLCCGDGSYSYLFFSDIASEIDAVDNNAYALAYAVGHFSSPTIKYHKVDVIREPLPSTEYDFIVWNAAICYFEQEEIKLVLNKIIKAGKKSMRLSGMLPKANGWIDHKTEFADSSSIEMFLRAYFEIVTIREVDEGAVTTFYFDALKPLALDL